MTGDSILLQASYYGGGLRGADDDGKIGLGWQAENAYPRVTQDIADPATSPEVLVVAFGQNDAMGTPPLFTAEDRQQMLDLVLAPHDAACTAIVKPHYSGVDPVRVLNIADFRNWVDAAVARYPDRLVSVDWRPIAQAHPEYIADDGYHLRVPEVPAAATAYTDLMWDAAAACA